VHFALRKAEIAAVVPATNEAVIKFLSLHNDTALIGPNKPVA
jgi:hypothetical protein